METFDGVGLVTVPGIEKSFVPVQNGLAQRLCIPDESGKMGIIGRPSAVIPIECDCNFCSTVDNRFLKDLAEEVRGFIVIPMAYGGSCKVITVP